MPPRSFHHINGRTKPHKAEAYRLLSGIKDHTADLLGNRDCYGKLILIYKDSQAAIQALSNFESKTKLAKETESALNNLFLRTEVRLVGF